MLKRSTLTLVLAILCGSPAFVGVAHGQSEKETVSPNVRKKIENAMKDYLFRDDFSIVKTTFKDGKINWLLQANVNASSDKGDWFFVRLQRAEIRFLDKDRVALGSTLLDKIFLPPIDWRKGERVRCSLSLPEHIDFTQVGHVRIFDLLADRR